MSRHHFVGFGRTKAVREHRHKMRVREILSLIAKYEKQKQKTKRLKERLLQLVGGES